ncbi:MAG: histidine kinase dimerization/phosphoacceptor domain -containing protein, partial [Bacteroidota bacterium]
MNVVGRKLGLLGMFLCTGILSLQAQSTDSLIQYWSTKINEVRATSEADVSAAFIDKAIRSTADKEVKGAIYLERINLFHDDPDYYEEAMLSADKAAALFQSTNNFEKLATAFYKKASMIIKDLNYDSVYFYLDQSEKYYRQVGAIAGIAKVELRRGTSSYLQSNYTKSQQHYYEALRLYESIGDSLGRSRCFYYLGELSYYCCQNYEDAKENHQKAIDLLPQIYTNTTIFLARTLSRLGNIAEYGTQKDLQTGLDYHYQALEKLKEIQEITGEESIQNQISGAYKQIADNLMLQKKYKEALETLGFAYQLLEERDHYDRFSYLITIGEAKGTLGQYEEAVNDIKTAIKAFTNANDLPNLRRANQTLSALYESQGEYATALAYYKIYKSYNDSLLDEGKISSMRVVELNYTYEKQRELDSLEARNEQLALANELGQYKSARNYLSIILALVLCGAGVIYWLYYNRNQANLQLQTTNQALQEQTEIVAQQNVDLATKNQENEVLLKEIHHRVKNNLQTISSLLSMQSATLMEEKAQVAIMQSQSRVQSIALIHQKLYQRDHLMGIEIKSYLDTLIQNL